MAIQIKLLPCFGSSKWPKMELIMESVLSRGPLWKNTHFMEHNSNGKVIPGQDGQPLCQELENETVAEMSQCLVDEDGQLEGVTPKGGATPKEKDTAKIVVLPPNDNTTFVPASEFPGTQYGLSTQENPVNLSDAPTEVSHTGMHPEGTDSIDESTMLGHFSNILSEMAKSLMDLEDGYFKALHEVIVETKRALRDISHIDAHYISQVVTVMASWQEAVQTAVTHMENADLTI